MAGEEVLLSVRDLVLRVNGRNILDGINLAFRRGRVHALVGPNGAGKSSLAGCIMGLSGYAGHGGEILFEGTSLRGKGVDERARLGITLAWQEPARFEGLTVEHFILAGAREKRRETAERVLDQVGLEPAVYLSRAVDRTLSGGERKRIELASILAMVPRLVLLDEPDSGIDVEALERIFGAIDLLRSAGSTVVLITHSLTVLRRAEYAYLMCCGRIIGEGPVERVERFFGTRCSRCRHQNEPVAGEKL